MVPARGVASVSCAVHRFCFPARALLRVTFLVHSGCQQLRRGLCNLALSGAYSFPRRTLTVVPGHRRGTQCLSEKNKTSSIASVIRTLVLGASVLQQCAVLSLRTSAPVAQARRRGSPATPGSLPGSSSRGVACGVLVCGRAVDRGLQRVTWCNICRLRARSARRVPKVPELLRRTPCHLKRVLPLILVEVLPCHQCVA